MDTKELQKINQQLEQIQQSLREPENCCNVSALLYLCQRFDAYINNGKDITHKEVQLIEPILTWYANLAPDEVRVSGVPYKVPRRSIK